MVVISAKDIPEGVGNIQIIYKEVPFYLTWQFAIAVGLGIALIVLSIYTWWRLSLRNRTNVIIHMPDRTRRFYSYKHFTGDRFILDTYEKDKDNKPIPHEYFFREDALETGYFGRYIEYDYCISEPRRSSHNKFEGFKDIFKFVSALLNTDLAVDLLLSQKFKDFVKMMLIVIVVSVIINVLISGAVAYQTFNTPQSMKCSLLLNNETINTWKVLQSIK